MTSKLAQIAIEAGYVRKDDPEFYTFGIPIAESDELVDFIYETYFGMDTDKGWAKNADFEIGTSDIVDIYKNGIYIPTCHRLGFTEFVDLRNSTLPDRASILKINNGNPEFIVVRKVKLPAGWVAPVQPATIYKLFIMWKDAGQSQFEMRNTFFCVRHADGRVFPCLNTAYGNFSYGVANTQFWGGFVATAVLNAHDDSHHLWHVVTRESIISNSIKTPLVLGCEADMVKSLFYARDMPLTDTGRKRPILHWVNAHKRRLKENHDVDISRHMRGITEFTMGTFSFSIVNPVKKAP